MILVSKLQIAIKTLVAFKGGAVVERNFSIPVTFAIMDEVQGKDTRFLKIVIDVLHTGKNFNGSIFDEDVVNDAIPSIKNLSLIHI